MACRAPREPNQPALYEKYTTLYHFAGTLHYTNIVESIDKVERLLRDRNVPSSKIKVICELLIETLQNMFNYTQQTTSHESSSAKATCSFTLSYNARQDQYLLYSCNLIDIDQRTIIWDRVNMVKSLDKKALRKLTMHKIRNGEDRHEKGAGIGFLVMSRKTSEPIHVSFAPYDDRHIRYLQRLVI